MYVVNIFFHAASQQDVLLPLLESQEKEAAEKSARDKIRRKERKRKRSQAKARASRKEKGKEKKTAKATSRKEQVTERKADSESDEEPPRKKAKKPKVSAAPTQPGLFQDPHLVPSTSVSCNHMGTNCFLTVMRPTLCCTLG